MTRNDSTARLATFAASLDPDRIPSPVRDLARDCLIDAVACARFGARLPWTRMAATAAADSTGKACPPGFDQLMSAPRAALIAGVAAHGFELDSLRKPGAGVHPGATVALPALMLAQETGASGRDLLTAIVAGIEVMFRIGAATLHSAEGRGFHAPGITGVFGAAVAAGRLLGLDSGRMEHAMGLAASMSGGILAFAGTGTGGMVKRLHLGRAAEAGINAARLAQAGFEAPYGVLEARFGVLDTFCARSDPSLLTSGLGREWETRLICFKRYACHVTAQAPVERMRGWIAEGLRPQSIRAIRITASAKITAVHGGRRPADLALAQYSLPFMLAFAAYHDIEDPAVLTDTAIRDPQTNALCDRIVLIEDTKATGWAAKLELDTDEGPLIAEAGDFLGVPDRPLDRAALLARFLRLAGPGQAGTFEALAAINHTKCVVATEAVAAE